MKLKKCISNIIKLEDKIDINQKALSWKNIHIWPLVREVLVYTMKFNIKNTSENGALKYNKLSWEKKAKDHIRTINKDVDILFFSRNADNREWVGKNMYNPIIDPLLETFETKLNCAKLEVKQPFDKKQSNLCYPPLVIDIRRNSCSIVDENDFFRNTFEPLRQLILEEIQVDIDPDVVLNQLLIIKEYEKFYRSLLEQINPKIVLFVCCKALPNKGLILACRSLNIAVVDVQHGFQGKLNVAYHHWTDLPVNGYNLLPTHFWVWGVSFAENINRWFKTYKKLPKAINGGNLWAIKSIKGDYQPNENQLESLISISNPYDKVILVTTNSLPNILLQSMKTLPKNWLWLFREHPHFKSDIPTIEKTLSRCDIKNYNINFSSNVSLYLLLRKCHAHVTLDSTIAYEAMFYSIPSIILDIEGFDFFSDLHDLGVLFYSESKESICKNLYYIINNQTDIKVPSKFFQLDENIVDKSINEILKGS